MSYTARLRIEIPADLYQVGRAISRALDPDVGGAESWMRVPPVDSSSENPVELPITGYITETPCTPAFAEQAIAMMAAPEMLHAVVSADYAARWADLIPPTLEECELFCETALVTDPSTKAENPTND